MFHLHPLKPGIHRSQSSSMHRPYDRLTTIHIILINCKYDLKFGTYRCGITDILIILNDIKFTLGSWMNNGIKIC